MAFREAINSFKSGYYNALNNSKPKQQNEWTTKPESDLVCPPGPEFMYQEVLQADNVEDGIRILELLPGKAEDVIYTKLAVAPLGAETRFEALSYVWGSPADPLPIYVDGKVLKITQNLRTALRHLRSPTQSRTLWIDAICINQNDMDEKSYQVGLMGKIYRASSNTVIWVGPATADSQEAFRRCEMLSKAAKDGSDDPIQNIKWSPAMERIAQGVLTPESAPQWNHEVLTLLRRPWFTRGWVLQEAILSPSSELRCGLERIEWSDFKQAIFYAFEKDLLIAHSDRVTYLNRIFNAHHFIPTKRDGTNSNPADLFLRYLMDFRHRQVTVSADKIFSLLGLVENIDTIDICADYKLSTQQVFKNTTVQILKNVDHLNILGAAGLVTNVQAASAASWIADWATDSLQAEALGHTASDTVNATRSSVSHLTFEDNDNIMVLSGHAVAKIDSISAILPIRSFALTEKYDSSGDSAEKLMSKGNFLSSAKAMLGSGGTLSTSYDIMTQGLMQTTSALQAWETFAGINKANVKSNREYWQTLCAEHYLNNNEALTEREFLAWYEILATQRGLSRVPLVGQTKLAATLSHLKAIWNRSSRFPEVLHFAFGRRLARVGESLALVPQQSEVGNEVLLCKGGRVPLIARRKGDRWLLLGEAYVHGMMHGQAFDEGSCRELRFE